MSVITSHEKESIVVHVISWFFVFGLFAIWSLAVWVVHAAAVWTVTNASTMSGVVSGIDGVHLPEWLTNWIPPEFVQLMISQLSSFAPVVEGLLQTAPSLTSSLTMVTWVIWGLGSVLLVMLGAGLHLLIAMTWRRGVRSGSLATGQVDS